MKIKVFLLFIVAQCLFACKQPAANDTAEVVDPNGPIISFEKEVYDFGKIKEGELVHYDYQFTNTGKTPLIIANATATCGCTVPEVPKEPIKPGESGIIKVIFDSHGKPGLNDKVITILSNAQTRQSQVHLIGEVLEIKK